MQNPGHPNEFDRTRLMRPPGATDLNDNQRPPAQRPAQPNHPNLSPPTVILPPNNNPTILNPQGGNTGGREQTTKSQSQPATELISRERTHVISESPVGFLAVIGGLGRGNVLPIMHKSNSVGRARGEVKICLDFGDNEISRKAHCLIIFDNRERSFYLALGTETGTTHLNDKLLVTSAKLKEGDIIQLGQTFLRFFPMCGPTFSWDDAPFTRESFESIPNPE